MRVTVRVGVGVGVGVNLGVELRHRVALADSSRQVTEREEDRRCHSTEVAIAVMQKHKVFLYQLSRLGEWWLVFNGGAHATQLALCHHARRCPGCHMPLHELEHLVLGAKGRRVVSLQHLWTACRICERPCAYVHLLTARRLS